LVSCWIIIYLPSGDRGAERKIDNLLVSSEKCCTFAADLIDRCCFVVSAIGAEGRKGGSGFFRKVFKKV